MTNRLLGGPAATSVLSRTHAEIDGQAPRLQRLLAGVDGDPLTPADLTDPCDCSAGSMPSAPAQRP